MTCGLLKCCPKHTFAHMGERLSIVRPYGAFYWVSHKGLQSANKYLFAIHEACTSASLRAAVAVDSGSCHLDHTRLTGLRLSGLDRLVIDKVLYLVCGFLGSVLAAAADPEADCPGVRKRIRVAGTRVLKAMKLSRGRRFPSPFSSPYAGRHS